MIDLTLPCVEGMTTFPGDPTFAVDHTVAVGQSAPANVSRYCLGSHTGTHVDPPAHFLPGAATVDALPLEALVGPAWVVNLEHVPAEIGPEELASAAIPSPFERVLLKTRNSLRWANPCHPFTADYVALGLGGARWLVERGVRLVGIDYLSIEAFISPSYPVHRLLLAHGVVIVEGLDLRAPNQGACYLCCLPLKVAGGDGAPARVVLL